jgi:hypothetical protein
MTGDPPVRRRRPWALTVGIAVVAAVAAVGVTVTAVGTIDEAASPPSFSADRVAPPAPAVVIGDSAIAALRWVPNASGAIVGFDHTLDLESCRRLVAPSCRGREGRTPPNVSEAMEFHDDNYHTLVVATGYNDGTFGYADAFTSIVGDARDHGYERIVWWSLRSDVDYVSPGAVGNHETYAVNNAVIEQLLATGEFPDVFLADWGGYTSDQVEWFATDGVHYRSVGAWAAADYLTRKMAYLDERACPVPDGPFEEPLDPCPDPDVTGPVADIEALYPVGVDGVLCYEVGDERRFECRYDTHVLQLERELSEGMEGPDVSALQTRLQRLGYFDHPITRLFGPITRDAVIAYQSDTPELATTGVADVATLAMLGFDVGAIET